MAFTLTVPSEVEESLELRARELGISVENYALRLLLTEEAAEPAKSPMTGPEAVAFWRREGVIGSRPDIEDSQAFARRLREEAQSRCIEPDAEENCD